MWKAVEGLPVKVHHSSVMATTRASFRRWSSHWIMGLIEESRRVLVTLLLAGLLVACDLGQPLVVEEHPAAGPQHAAAIAQAKLDHAEAMVECLRQRGLNVWVSDDGGGIEGRNFNLNPRDYFRMHDECEVELVAAGRIEPPATASREYFEGAYDYNLTVRSCLEAQGYTVVAPPTKESYVESQGENWVPIRRRCDRLSGGVGGDQPALPAGLPTLLKVLPLVIASLR